MFWQPYRCTTPRLLASCGHRRYESICSLQGGWDDLQVSLQVDGRLCSYLEHFPPPVVVPVGLVGVEPPTSG